jgi:transposase InsO family protein
VYGLNNEERRGKWAEFRFAVIAPLVCRRLDEAEWQELRREVLSQVYVTPDGDERRFSERTIREWIARYRLHGLPGLRRMVRKDRGVLKALSVEVAGEAYRLREELRTRSISGILAHLRVKSIDADKISKTTLNRYLNNVGLEREKIKAEKGTFQRWQKEHANDLCQADTSGGVWIPDPRNPKVLKQTRLVSFIDDATRVCTHAEFYWDEQLPSLLDCFRKALLKRGKPRRLLCDNAFIYHSRALKSACARLGIELSFCKEYFPEGKGKVEKHYGTIKSRFYEEAKHAGLGSLEELNKFWFAWLTREYHRSNHSALGMTPVQRWSIDEEKGFVERVSVEQVRRALMINEKRKAHIRTSLIRLKNRTFQLAPEMAGKTVNILYEPFKLDDHVEVWLDGAFVQVAHEVRPEANIDFSRKPERRRERKQNHAVLLSSRDYKNALMSAHEGEAIGVRDEYMAQTEFEEMAVRLLERDVTPDESEFLSKFFAENIPLKTKRTEYLFSQVVNAKGTKLHVRSYCQNLKAGLSKQRR